MKKNKHLIRMTVLVPALTGAFLWVSHMVQEMHDFDDDLNETYLDYQAHPEEYIECEAEITAHIPYEGLWSATKSALSVTTTRASLKTAMPCRTDEIYRKYAHFPQAAHRGGGDRSAGGAGDRDASAEGAEIKRILKGMIAA